MKSGKPSMCYSDNPKMGQPYASPTPVKGYQDGGLVPEEEKTSRLQLQGGMSTMEATPVSGVSVRAIGGGGRAGYRIPMDKDRDVTVGISGNAYKTKVNTPDGTFKDSKARITGVDASYRKKDTTVGVSVRRSPDKMDGKEVMFTYRKDF